MTTLEVRVGGGGEPLQTSSGQYTKGGPRAGGTLTGPVLVPSNTLTEPFDGERIGLKALTKADCNPPPPTPKPNTTPPSKKKGCLRPPLLPTPLLRLQKKHRTTYAKKVTSKDHLQFHKVAGVMCSQVGRVGGLLPDCVEGDTKVQ